MHLRRLLPLAAMLLLAGCGSGRIAATAEQTTEPTASQTAQPTVQPTIQSTTQSTTESTTESTTQSTTESTTESTTQPTTQPTMGSTTKPTAAVTVTENWMLRLANRTHPVGEYEPPELTLLKNGVQVDSRMYPALQRMFDDMRAQGLKPFVREGYRTYAQQVDIMETRIRSYRSQGYSEQKATALAKDYVAEPGTSEHQLGLAVDINAENGNNWSVYNWLAVHAQEYGFILRYPQDGKEITGYEYEPWHYRYVGTDAAKEIYDAKTTLEEYLGAVGEMKEAS